MAARKMWELLDCLFGRPANWTREEFRSGAIYTGDFVARRPSGRPLHVRGRIVEWPGLPSDVYVQDPPPALRRHPHGPCFQLLGPDRPGWFKLHWHKPAQDFETS